MACRQFISMNQTCTPLGNTGHIAHPPLSESHPCYTATGHTTLIPTTRVTIPAGLSRDIGDRNHTHRLYPLTGTTKYRGNATRLHPHIPSLWNPCPISLDTTLC